MCAVLCSARRTLRSARRCKLVKQTLKHIGLVLQLEQPHRRVVDRIPALTDRTIIMRSPIEFEKAHTYDRCRESIDSDDYPRPNSIDEAEESLTKESEPAPPPPPYSAFSINRRRFILGTVTAAGFFGPLCGAVYLPSLNLFQTIFKTNASAINGTVSMYMVVFAVAVSNLGILEIR